MRRMLVIAMIGMILGGIERGDSLAQGMDPAHQERIVRGLSDPSFKVRLEATILVGKLRIARALPGLIGALRDRHEAVRAAAAVSVAKFGNQEHRRHLVPMLSDRNKMVIQSVEQALMLLDKERGGPRIFLVFEPLSDVAGKVPPGMSYWVLDRLREHLRASSAVVLSSGEEKVLSPPLLASHLRRRKMVGFNIKAKIARLDQQPGRRSTRARCEVAALVYTLTGSRVEFVASGSADAEIDSPRLTPKQKDEVDHTVVAAAAKASAGKTLQYLRERLER